MENELKTTLLDQLGAKELGAVLAALSIQIPKDHPAAGRVGQLDKRFRELEGRIAQGTLSAQDIDRVRSRIAGGLREIILDYRPVESTVKEEEEPEKVPFTLDFTEEKKVMPEEPPQESLGFKGEVNYEGSPSKKEASLVLEKGYGAAFHAAVQGIRKCGMDMVKGDRINGTIHATAPGNTVARFGEDIFMWLTPKGRGRTLVQVIVDSANPKTTFDLGRNQQKLQALTHQLRNS